jgi:hypothetical protein
MDAMTAAKLVAALCVFVTLRVSSREDNDAAVSGTSAIWNRELTLTRRLTAEFQIPSAPA